MATSNNKKNFEFLIMWQTWENIKKYIFKNKFNLKSNVWLIFKKLIWSWNQITSLSPGLKEIFFNSKNTVNTFKFINLRSENLYIFSNLKNKCEVRLNQIT